MNLLKKLPLLVLMVSLSALADESNVLFSVGQLAGSEVSPGDLKQKKTTCEVYNDRVIIQTEFQEFVNQNTYTATTELALKTTVDTLDSMVDRAQASFQANQIESQLASSLPYFSINAYSSTGKSVALADFNTETQKVARVKGLESDALIDIALTACNIPH